MADNTCQLIESLEQKWRDALCAQDLDQLRDLVHPDFVLIGTRSGGPYVAQVELNTNLRTRKVTAASSRFRPEPTLLRKYLVGFVMDSPTRACAAK